MPEKDKKQPPELGLPFSCLAYGVGATLQWSHPPTCNTDSLPTSSGGKEVPEEFGILSVSQGVHGTVKEPRKEAGESAEISKHSTS